MARRLGFAWLRQTHLPEHPSMGRIFASAVAGLSGAATHWLLMMSKQQLRLFPEFQPYESFQRLLISPWAVNSIRQPRGQYRWSAGERSLDSFMLKPTLLSRFGTASERD